LINYDWEISYLGTYPVYEELPDVVYQIHWRFQATEVDEDQKYFSEIYSATDITCDVSGAFTPFEDLTKEPVVEWLKIELGREVAIDSMKSQLASNIDNQKNPQTVIFAPPWAS